MNSDRLREIYKYFCTAEGNQHIASEFAIIKIKQLIHQFKVKGVLEVGLGIGSIAGSVLSANSDIRYVGTENHNFCLDALKKNLDENYSNLEIFSELSEVPESKFDLIIIDGKDSGLANIRQLINTRGIIVIEGDRSPQQELLIKYFPQHKFVHSISSKKNGDYSPFSSNHWQGGLKIIFVSPNLFQKMWWLKEKVSTKFKNFGRAALKSRLRKINLH